MSAENVHAFLRPNDSTFDSVEPRIEWNSELYTTMNSLFIMACNFPRSKKIQESYQEAKRAYYEHTAKQILNNSTPRNIAVAMHNLQISEHTYIFATGSLRFILNEVR